MEASFTLSPGTRIVSFCFLPRKKHRIRSRTLILRQERIPSDFAFLDTLIFKLCSIFITSFRECFLTLYLIALRKHGKRRFRKNLLFINGKCQSIEPLRSQAKRKVQILTWAKKYATDCGCMVEIFIILCYSNAILMTHSRKGDQLWIFQKK